MLRNHLHQLFREIVLAVCVTVAAIVFLALSATQSGQDQASGPSAVASSGPDKAERTVAQ